MKQKLELEQANADFVRQAKEEVGINITPTLSPPLGSACNVFSLCEKIISLSGKTSQLV